MGVIGAQERRSAGAENRRRVHFSSHFKPAYLQYSGGYVELKQARRPKERSKRRAENQKRQYQRVGFSRARQVT